MKTKSTIILLLLMGVFFTAKSQDLIYKKNNEVIMAKILEIGVDEIKYKEFNNQSGPTFAIDKNEITRIKFENGKTQYFGDNIDNPNLYADNKKNAIKVDFLSYMFGQTTFGYERSLKPGMSIEANIGIIGLGTQNNSDATANGAFLRIGYKFIRTPDFYLKGMRYAHVLKGSYIRPEISLGACTENIKTYNNGGGSIFGYSYGTPTTVTKNVSYGSIMLDFGKQWVMSDIFLVDYFVGIGYGFSSKTIDKDYGNMGFDSFWPYNSNNHSMIGPFGSSGTGYVFPLAFTMGLKVGILIK